MKKRKETEKIRKQKKRNKTKKNRNKTGKSVKKNTEWAGPCTTTAGANCHPVCWTMGPWIGPGRAFPYWSFLCRGRESPSHGVVLFKAFEMTGAAWRRAASATATSGGDYTEIPAPRISELPLVS
jgi:hypothetical protein